MVRKMLLCFLCLSLFLLISDCKKSSPETPDVPAIIQPTAQSITVTSTSDMLYIGISETFMAMVTMSDGSVKAVVGGVWGGDNPSVATVVAATGQVSIVGSGMVNVFVDYEGKRGSKAIRGLPNYQGTWTGSYAIASCNATGDFLIGGFCGIYTIGMQFPTDLVLTQNQDQVTGRFYLGFLSADAVGPVATDGQLLLTGKIISDPFTIDVAWQLQSTTPGQITGALSQLHLGTGWIGDGQLLCTVISISRTSTVAMAPFAEQPSMTPTLRDVLRALLRR